MPAADGRGVNAEGALGISDVGVLLEYQPVSPDRLDDVSVFHHADLQVAVAAALEEGAQALRPAGALRESVLVTQRGLF